MSVDLALSLLLFAAFMAYAARRLFVLLHVFQQEEYDAGRFLHGIFRSQNGRLVWEFWNLRNPSKKAKKPLKMTARAWRTYVVSLLVTAFFLSGWFSFPSWSKLVTTILILALLLPSFLASSNFFLWPYERSNQRRYWRQAHEKLTRLGPVVIGITGSYGKTSVKHILAHILAAHAPTLATPGSVNTPMGVTRIIRERLEPRHKYFIVEMGAYGLGSIARLCDLAPPQHAIITAIGPAHLERFGSLATTALAKAELAKAATGTVVLPRALLEHAPFAQLYESEPSRFVILDAPEVTQEKDGLTVCIDDEKLHAPLYGLHHGANVALAYTLARALGLDPALIKETLRSVPQIEHRLAVTTYPTGAVLIDDAYNANPAGMRAALDLLDFLADGHKRRVLVTPGVVELGAEHGPVHADLGAYAAQKADVIIAVAARRIPSFVQAAQAAQVLEVQRFSEAQAWLAAHTGPRDVILIANDLPDILEG
jgi:UDP-N-acetylmuramoyl-tripeptide--D-alanyl-D-alanine ligase